MLGLSAQGWGGYLSGYTDWRSLPPVAKGAYVAGASDYMSQLATPSDPFQSALSKAVGQCLVAAHTTDIALANDVDRLYGD
jgi:hypothetical protein